MRSFIKCVVLSFLFLSLGVPVDVQGSPSSLYESEIVKLATENYLSSAPDEKIYRFDKNTVIKKGEEYLGHILVIKGNLAIRGKVKGDVLVIKGDVHVYNTGYVEGNITAVDGKIHVYDNGKVYGEMLETHVENLLGKNRKFTRKFKQALFNHKLGTVSFGDHGSDFMFKYNRVEGMFLGINFPKDFIPEYGRYSTYGFIGYGFKSKDMRFQLNMDRWFFDPYEYRFEIGAEVHSLTDTKDDWRLSVIENNLSALLFKEDFFDYFERKGFSFYLSQYYTPFFKIKLAYRNDEYKSLTNNANWAFFGKNKVFRPNQLITGYEGNMHSIYGEVIYDNRDEIDFTTTGWLAHFSVEFASSRLGGCFNFNRYLMEIRHYWPLVTGENLNFRLMVGSSEGDLPIQKNFELGGISTLRGYPYKIFSGNSMVLINIEYRVHPRIISSQIPFIGSAFSLIFFTDFGKVWETPVDYDLLDRLKMFRLTSIKNDVGLAIAHPEGKYRLNIAKRIDSSDKDIVVTLRISQPF